MLKPVFTKLPWRGFLYCPVYEASAAACSACVAGDYPTFASTLASILTTNCAGQAAVPTANPTGPSQTQAVAPQTSTIAGGPASTGAHSGARGGFDGIVGEHYIGIVMAIAVVAGFWSLFM